MPTQAPKWRKKKDTKKIDLKQYAAKIPCGDSEEQIKLQNELFSWFDVSANGSLSLSEIELGILQFIGEEIYLMKPATKMAFKAARNSGENDEDDEAVEIDEFRALLINIRVYIELWIAFDELDENQDHRIEYDEFLAGLAMIEKWGVKVDNPKAEFAKIDDNSGGYILFDEFCEWAIAKGLDYDPTFGVGISDEEIARHLAEAKAAAERKKRAPKSYKLRKKTLKEIPDFLEKIYSKRDPEKAKEIPDLIKKHKGREVQFIKRLVGQYGIKQEDIPEELKKYTARVKRKAQEQTTIKGLINELHAMNARHQTVMNDLKANNILLEKRLNKQQKQLAKANKLIEQQQEEVNHMHRLVETFILQQGGTVFDMYQQSPHFDYASSPEYQGRKESLAHSRANSMSLPNTPRGGSLSNPSTPRRKSRGNSRAMDTGGGTITDSIFTINE